MPDQNMSGLMLKDDSAAAGLTLPAPEVHFGTSKKEQLDFNDQVERMLDDAKKRHSNLGLKLDAIGFAPIVTPDGEPADADERSLQVAREHIRAERYDEALEVLGEVLQRRRDHAEAIYLTAWCQAQRSDEDEAATEAARTLRPLRPGRVERTLAIRVADLRETLRARRFVPVIDRLMALTEAEDDRVPFLREELSLDPGFALLHGVLASDLAARGDFEGAIRVADEAAEVLPPDEQAPVRNIRNLAASQLAARAMEPVRDLYRRGNFSAAYGALVKLDTHRETRLVVTFEAYLRELSDGATGFWRGLFAKTRTPAEVRPIGDSATLDELGFFLVRPDLDTVHALNAKGLDAATAAQAEVCALNGTLNAPWFPFIHFVLANCMFTRLIESMNGSKGPSLDAIEADLNATKSHFEIAVTDKEIEAAPDGLKQVREMLTHVKNAKRIQAERETEIRTVNETIEEFNETLKSVSGGLRHAEDYRRVRARLEALRTKLPSLIRTMKSEHSKAALMKLSDAVKSHLEQLDKLRRLL